MPHAEREHEAHLPQILQSRLSAEQKHHYGVAVRAAASVIRRRLRVLQLLHEAYVKLHSEDEAMKRMREDMMKLLRMVKAWALGEYKQIPWRALVFSLGAILYFVLPVDLIPDFLPGIGFVDDAIVVSSVVSALRSDIRAWEAATRQRQLEPGHPSATAPS